LPHATLESPGGTELTTPTAAEPSGRLEAGGVDKVQLLYIASASFSGSTLLTFLLAAHPKLATVGELKATSMGDVEQYRCSCGELIRGCGFWQRLTKLLRERGVAFDVARFGTHFRFREDGSLADRFVRAQVRGRLFEAARKLALRVLPGATDEFLAILARNRLLVETICQLRGARVFLDGSKEPNRLKYLVDSGLWDVKVVHLVRDGRGLANRRLQHMLQIWPELTDRLAIVRKAASAWRRVNVACERVLESLPPQARVRVRYEDLCRDPAAALAPVFAMIGESAPAVPDDFRTIEHHIVGNRMRLRREGRIVLDDKWRTELSAEELAAFDAVAGDMNRGMGYE
jgi:hypothetical protein